jgi:DNA mismatch repair protein MutL
MSDLIQLLSDSVANQIAAGEVVQRPASVVKELLENSIDAGSTKIQVIIKDAGKTLIQIIDNGCGMSDTDARMCFERHATSKIKQANDLFNIRTMGFRGEAMASIAAIASVEMKTKKHDEELGVFIRISGSKVEEQEPINCSNGTNISVKNLFFNVPARRKFLKTNSTELKHILETFQNIALGFPDINMKLIHNDDTIFDFNASKIYNRIVNIFGKSISKNLIPIQSSTSMANIKGYIGKPENAKKTGGEQFFFVNNRYMKHPYFYRAVLKAYENILKPGLIPSFFIYFDVDTETIDINIHPTKTEIKFENEQAMWAVIEATVKEGLGKHNIVPSIDFNQESTFEVSALNKNNTIKTPTINIDHSYNPFETSSKPTAQYNNFKKQDVNQWEQLYTGFETTNSTKDQTETTQQTIDINPINEANRFFQLKGKYILTAVKSGLMLINQKRAHQRIIFDEYINKITDKAILSQKLLYPYKLELNTIESELFKSILSEINNLGFEIEPFGNNTFVINSVPADFPDMDVSLWATQILDSFKENEKEFIKTVRENIVKTLSDFLAIPYGKTLTQQEMAHINDQLFSSQMPNISPNGKTIITIIKMEDLDKMLK